MVKRYYSYLPTAIIFDWHGTLVDTSRAMYLALEQLLDQLESLQLLHRIVPEQQAGSAENEKLVRYFRIYRRLHPQILAERRVSRTDIFDALFGDDVEAKRIAHQAYNRCYRQHYGEVVPLQNGIFTYLSYLKRMGIRLAIATNRSREFLDNELAVVEQGLWKPLFDATVCGDEVYGYKPEPYVLDQAIAKLGLFAGQQAWYVGDSVSDLLTADRAAVTAIFYNTALLSLSELQTSWRGVQVAATTPAAVVDDFEQLLDYLQSACAQADAELPLPRPARLPPRALPPPRQLPDWHPVLAQLRAPAIILFDWHATLVDTLDAMYHAVDDMLPLLRELGLEQRLITAEQSKSPEDIKLVEHVRNYGKLHPKVKADRKISRTDIFEVLFGNDEEAKRIAHRAFNHHYRNHYGTVLPFEPRVKAMLQGLDALNLSLGVITNRDREFFVHELAAVEGSGWADLFDTTVCGDDVPRRKPHPDQLQLALRNLNASAAADVWYVGDSTTDIIAAKLAGVTAVFFNGAQWDLDWLNKIFPGTPRYPHRPDVVVNDFAEFWALVLACMHKHRRGS